MIRRLLARLIPAAYDAGHRDGFAEGCRRMSIGAQALIDDLNAHHRAQLEAIHTQQMRDLARLQGAAFPVPPSAEVEREEKRR